MNIRLVVLPPHVFKTLSVSLERPELFWVRRVQNVVSKFHEHSFIPTSFSHTHTHRHCDCEEEVGMLSCHSYLLILALLLVGGGCSDSLLTLEAATQQMVWWEVMSVRWSKIEVNQCHNDERRTLDQLGGSRLGDFKIKASLKAEHFCRWCDNRLCHVAHAYQRDINRMLRYPPANPFSSTLPWNQTTTVAELYPAFPVLMQFSSAGAACNGLAVWHFDMSNQQAWSQLDIPDHSAPFIAGIIFKPWLWFVF